MEFEMATEVRWGRMGYIPLLCSPRFPVEFQFRVSQINFKICWLLYRTLLHQKYDTRLIIRSHARQMRGAGGDL